MSHTPDYPAWPLDMLHDELRGYLSGMGPIIAELAARDGASPPVPAPRVTPLVTAPRVTPLVTAPPVGLGQTSLTLAELITELGRFSASTWPTLARDDELARLLDALQDLATRALDEQDSRLPGGRTPGHDHPSVWTTPAWQCHP